MAKDNKGRNLRQNESQLKDGRYRYRYTDKYGKRNAVYSWKLVPTDKTPIGKKEDISLREKEKEIGRDLDDGINIYQSTISVVKLLQRYLSVKPKLAESTKNNYLHMIDKNIKDNPIGSMRVCDVKKSDILKYYTYLSEDRKFKAGSIQLYQNLLYPAFQLAVEDSIIRLNPCKGCMKDYVKGALSSTKYPLTRQQQDALLNFVKNDKIYSIYYTLIVFMLSSGCRISEALGLTWDDLSLDGKYVKVDHQVIYKKKDGKTQHYAAPPKNKKSRTIPLKDDIVAIMNQHKSNTYFISKSSGFEVDGYKDFIFINTASKIYTPHTIVRALHGIRDAYNDEEIRLAHDENREPNLLPDFSPHTFRHTYCTRMAENGIDVRVLQEIMGHKSISVTMEVYNHVDTERSQKAVQAIESVL